MGDLIELWRRRLRPDTGEASGVVPPVVHVHRTRMPPDLKRDELIRVLNQLDMLFDLDCRLAAAIIKVADYQREEPVDQVALRRAVTHITLAVELLEKSI